MRKSIPETIKLQLWVKAGGRCEFKGCNKVLWRNGLTLSDGNFAQYAHIIAASEAGPRGAFNSDDIQMRFDNLMLLCPDCHREIDSKPQKYPAELLRKWKNEHEERIEIQTSIPKEIHLSSILIFQVNIGDRIVPINEAAVFNAMFPRYPTDKKGIRIEKHDFDRFESPEYWKSYSVDIKRKIKHYFDYGFDDKQIKHLSVFAIAPMPLLIFLGRCLGDTVPTDIYQSHRNILDTNQTWTWQDEDDIETNFVVNEIRQAETKKVVLKIALSDTISEEKYSKLIDNTFSIYEITIIDPSPHFIKNRKQLEEFSKKYRLLLNKIQERHGRDCELYLVPAMPVSIAIECGRVILPTKDPNIFACEYYTDQGFKSVLKIN